MEPFVTEAIWTEAVMDVLPVLGRGGQTIEGVKVYNDQADFGTKAKQIFLHLICSVLLNNLPSILDDS